MILFSIKEGQMTDFRWPCLFLVRLIFLAEEQKMTSQRWGNYIFRNITKCTTVKSTDCLLHAGLTLHLHRQWPKRRLTYSTLHDMIFQTMKLFRNSFFSILPSSSPHPASVSVRSFFPEHGVTIL